MHRQKVLVVDDNNLILWALDKEFASLEIHSRNVSTAREAIAELRKNFYGIAFVDINLPDGNGIELLEEVRRISPDTMVVIMSATAGHGDLQRAFAAGAHHFLEKPFVVAEVHRILRTTAETSRRNRKSPRHIYRIPLRFSIDEPSSDEAQCDLRNLDGFASDFGPGGVRIRTEYPLRVGQSIRARASSGYEFFHQLVPAESDAEVVWIRPSEDGLTAGLKIVATPARAS